MSSATILGITDNVENLNVAEITSRAINKRTLPNYNLCPLGLQNNNHDEFGRSLGGTGRNTFYNVNHDCNPDVAYELIVNESKSLPTRPLIVDSNKGVTRKPMPYTPNLPINKVYGNLYGLSENITKSQQITPSLPPINKPLITPLLPQINKL